MEDGGLCDTFPDFSPICTTEGRDCFNQLYDLLKRSEDNNCDDDNDDTCDDDEVEITENGNTYCYPQCNSNSDCCQETDNSNYANCTVNTNGGDSYCLPNDPDEREPESDDNEDLDFAAAIGFFCVEDPNNDGYCVANVVGSSAFSGSENTTCDDFSALGCCLGTTTAFLNCTSEDVDLSALKNNCQNVDFDTKCSGTPDTCGSGSGSTVLSLSVLFASIAASLFVR